jgi:hypothetical protein
LLCAAVAREWSMSVRIVFLMERKGTYAESDRSNAGDLFGGQNCLAR